VFHLIEKAHALALAIGERRQLETPTKQKAFFKVQHHTKCVCAVAKSHDFYSPQQVGRHKNAK